MRQYVDDMHLYLFFAQVGRYNPHVLPIWNFVVENSGEVDTYCREERFGQG
jgi:hypothetical protein